MLELYEKFIEFKQRTISTTNKLHISLPAVFQNSVFTHHLAAFIKEYPDVCLHISYSDTRKDIIAESIDVAFRIGDLPDSSLKARHLFVLPRKVVASKQLLSNYKPVNHPDDLAKMPWIGLTMRQNSREFRHTNGEVAIIKYTPTVYVDNVEGGLCAGKTTGRVGGPQSICVQRIFSAKRCRLLPDWSLEPLKVYAIWPSNISTSSIAYTLINKIYHAFEHHILD
jgi:DNA-binding transcriptional LysR family regulator